MPRIGFLTEKILDIIQDGVETSWDILNVFFAGYGESYHRAYRLSQGNLRHSRKRWVEEYRKCNQFYSLLSQLKKQGLIETKEKKKNSVWKITEKGMKKKKLLEERRMFAGIPTGYEKQIDSKFKVIIFDVPETERRKRVWLRVCLRTLGFFMCQKSVWMGKNKIPQNFLNDLREREMFEYVHIFEISKTGSIKQINIAP